jgi:hypothetical protein
VVTQPLIMPPAGSGRRELIEGEIRRSARTSPQVSLVMEDRGSWVAAAQAGMGSFLSYRCVVDGLEGLEIRPFDPAQTVMVGFVYRAGPISRPAAQLMDLAQTSMNLNT